MVMSPIRTENALNLGLSHWMVPRDGSITDTSRIGLSPGLVGVVLNSKTLLESLMVKATLPRIPLADHALAEYRAGHLRGFSLEFRAIEETRGDGLRIIQRAELAGIGLVDEPSYRGSQAELRARSGRTMRSRIPSEKNLSCRCSGAACKFARFAQGAVDEMLDEAFDRAANTIATWTDYSRPLASVQRGTLRRAGKDAIEIDVPTGAAGDAVLAASEDAGVIIRPFLDAAESESVQVRAR